MQYLPDRLLPGWSIEMNSRSELGAGSLALLLSPKRTAREAGEDPPDNEHGPCGDADEGSCDQHRLSQRKPEFR